MALGVGVRGNGKNGVGVAVASNGAETRMIFGCGGGFSSATTIGAGSLNPQALIPERITQTAINTDL